jgi:HSP20 family protein
MHHFHKMLETGYFSPAQALLQRLFPEALEYRLPDRDVVGIDADWVPTAEMVEMDTQINIQVELPGVEKENLSVKIKNNILWILGERPEDDSEKSKKYLCCERSYGNFARYIYLPDSADTDKVYSEYRNGLLKITFDKKKSVKPRDISIQLG